MQVRMGAQTVAWILFRPEESTRQHEYGLKWQVLHKMRTIQATNEKKSYILEQRTVFGP